MRKYNSQEEFEAEIKNGVFYLEDSIDITSFSLDVAADINAWGINAKDIEARDINAGDINAGDIKAGDINAGDINAGDIKAGDINAGDIKAGDINAGDIEAGGISYYAVAFAYRNIQAKSIEGRRKNARHFVLDGKIEIEEGELSNGQKSNLP